MSSHHIVSNSLFPSTHKVQLQTAIILRSGLLQQMNNNRLTQLLCCLSPSFSHSTSSVTWSEYHNALGISVCVCVCVYTYYTAQHTHTPSQTYRTREYTPTHKHTHTHTHTHSSCFIAWRMTRPGKGKRESSKQLHVLICSTFIYWQLRGKWRKDEYTSRVFLNVICVFSKSINMKRHAVIDS